MAGRAFTVAEDVGVVVEDAGAVRCLESPVVLAEGDLVAVGELKINARE